MNCVFIPEGTQLICRVCGRSIQSSAINVRRNCLIEQPLFPCVLFADHDNRKAWTLHYLIQEEIDALPVEFAVLLEDPTRIGSQFKKMAAAFDTQGCDCNALRVLLDACSLDFVQTHFDKFVDLIAASAKKNVSWLPIPRTLIALALRRAVRLEAKAWKNVSARSQVAALGTESLLTKPNTSNASTE